MNSSRWCSTTNQCPCLVRDFVRKRTSCFSTEDAAKELREPSEKILICLNNLADWDCVSRDRKRDLWFPDNLA